MKIVYLSNSSIPSKTANSVHVVKMSQALAFNNHEVMLIGKRDNKSFKNTFDIHDFYGVKNNFKFISLKSFNLRFISSFSYSVRAVLNAFCNKPDLVYTRDLVAAYILSKMKKNVIYECHTPHFNSLKKRMFFNLLKKSNLKRIVVISQSLKEIIIDTYRLEKNIDKLFVAHDGVDLERYISLPDKEKCRIEISEDRKKPLVGYIGHLYKGRGIELILKVAERLKDYDFMIVGGDKADIERIKGVIIEKNIMNVSIKGFIKNRDILNYLRACDVLLMPYQRKTSVANKGDTSRYMSPLKLFEYMASGVPIISSDLPVLKEVLIDYRNCLLANPENVDEWGTLINSLIESKALREKLINNQLMDIKEYSWTVRAKKIVSIL